MKRTSAYAMGVWIAWSSKRQRYTSIAFSIASRAEVGVLAMVFAGWRHVRISMVRDGIRTDGIRTDGICTDGICTDWI